MCYDTLAAILHLLLPVAIRATHCHVPHVTMNMIINEDEALSFDNLFESWPIGGNYVSMTFDCDT